MRRMMFAVFLFCFIQTYAKTPPIPEALLNAKTAFVENGGAEDKDFDKFCQALKEWGRFEFVKNERSADIVITLSTKLQDRTVQMPNTGGGFGGVNTEQVLISYIRIVNARDETPLWSDKTPSGSKDPRRLVDILKNKMKKK
jgi:hypothetical protein